MTGRAGEGERKAVLVVGAGMAGMAAAHYLAEWGAPVLLADSAPHIGGAFLLLDHTFTTDSCGLCIALPRQPSYCPTLSSDLHPGITLLPGTVLAALEGEAGNFSATLQHTPRYVDPVRCDNCGACAAVCPVVRTAGPARYGSDLPPQKAICPAPPRAVPSTYTLDPGACTRCGACVAACPHGAIDLDAAARPECEARLPAGAVVLAPGFAAFDAGRAAEYGWGRCANVLTSLQFEYMLNHSGATRGRPLRPSDGQVPGRIAFVHCVGSRSPALDRPYCSSSCCMITAKQVALARQVAPQSRLTVFTMDVRTAGKGYETYFARVAALPGVTYQRDMVAGVREVPGSRNLRLMTSGGTEEFDLVVLATGMGPSADVWALGKRAGVALDPHGFVLPGSAGAGSTSRPGVFVAGSALAPADVPETVTQAAAAAALAAGVLGQVAGAAGRRLLGTPEGRGEALADQPPRIGVFLCTCRGTLEAALDFATLEAAAGALRGVAHVERVPAACEALGLAAVERAVKEYGLNRVVIAGCSPRLCAGAFGALLARLDLPARLLARANLREGAAWPHTGDPAAALTAAQGEIAVAVAGLREVPYRPFAPCPQADAAPRVLVLGGGLAGMSAALTLAELGVVCDLVERTPHLGGQSRQGTRTLEGLAVRALLAQTEESARQAEQVHIWTQAELEGWSGVQGDFTARVRVGDSTRTERYGALIVATGATGAPPAPTRDYLYGRHPRVVTQREFEHVLEEGELQGSASCVMIQCVGSRDEARPYCSRICCAQAIKNALALKAQVPGVQVSVLFRDVRTPGTQELYYQQARRAGVRFVRYEPPAYPRVEVNGERLHLTVHDTLYGETVELQADWLVLSTGIAPAGNGPLAALLGVPLDGDGFFAEAHPKLRPTDLPVPGLFVCGLAYGPRFIGESVAQARAAALRAALVVARPPLPRVDVATVEADLCSFCGLCVSACPYGARALDREERVARVIEHLCRGCGTCVAVCPNSASRQPAFEPLRALAEVDAALS